MEIPIIPAEPFDLPSFSRIKRLSMFKAALRLQNIEPTVQVIDELNRTFEDGFEMRKIDRAWKDSAVPDVRNISWRWRTIMIDTTLKIMASYSQAERRAGMYPRHAESFPYFRVLMILEDCKRSPHAWLDGFAARWNDEIWKVLQQPFGWECGCMIRMVSDSEIPLGIEPLQPGLDRVPKDVLRSSIGWLDHNPSYLWDKSILPTRPHIPAEHWPDDPMRRGPTVQQSAILKRYGISVQITHTED